LLQQLAVIGRQFPLSLIRQVITQPETDLYRLLASLQHKEFLYEQPAFPESEYIFKHALTQEVAYSTVLHEWRKALHEQTAHAIEQLFHDKLEDRYSDLAHHYSRSGNATKAVEYLSLAGQQTAQRSAHNEAIAHLTTALELLKTLPNTPEHMQKELALQLALGPAVMAVKGYASQEASDAYIRARELCQRIGDTSHLFPVLWGLCLVGLVRGEYKTAYELGEQLLKLAQLTQDSALLMEAHYAISLSSLWLGDLQRAQEHGERSIAFYSPQSHRSHTFLYGQVSGVHGLVCVGWALWLLGFPAQALQKIQHALSLMREVTLPYSFAAALSVAAVVHQFRREERAVQERAEATIALSAEQGFSFWLALGSFFRGWALAEQGQGGEGITLMKRGLADFRAAASGNSESHWLALLAETYGKAGQIEEGLTVLTEALAVAEKNEERMYEAELWRLKGELTLQSQASLGQVEDKSQASLGRVKTGPGSSDPKSQSLNPKSQVEAEEYFWRAIEIARAQQAKSLELRAVMSLARLWQSQGKQREAHHMLSEIYNWFTEGFDTKDLQEAKALLEALT
jgi:predicted ATPase